MIQKTFKINIAFLLLCFIAPLAAIAQTDKIVTVFSDYTPTLSDAYKINTMPDLTDSISERLPIEYNIHPSRLSGGDFQLKPVKAARLVPESLDKLYKSYFVLGGGNTALPFFEFTTASLRSKRYAYKASVGHHASYAKLKLDNNERVPANFSNNYLDLQGETFLKNSILSANINASQAGILFYGYNPDSTITLEKDSIKQKYTTLSGGLNFKSTHNDSSHLNYNMGLNYTNFRDVDKISENHIFFKSDFNKTFKASVASLFVNVNYLGKSNSIDSSGNTIVEITPRWEKYSEEWQIKLGGSITVDGKQNLQVLYFYPKAYFQFNAASNIVVPYLGIDGYLEPVSYQTLALENVFFTPNLYLNNTNYSTILYGGIRTIYGNKLSSNFKISYSMADYLHFFVNDYANTNGLGNAFALVHDDGNILDLYGEVFYEHSEKLDFVVKGNYYQYNLNTLKHALHKPEYKVSLSATYNLKNKILAKTDVFLVGSQYALDANNNYVKLKGFVDANLGLEYRYTKVLSGFLTINNLTASKQQVWHQFPTYRFQVLAGFTYTL